MNNKNAVIQVMSGDEHKLWLWSCYPEDWRKTYGNEPTPDSWPDSRKAAAYDSLQQ